MKQSATVVLRGFSIFRDRADLMLEVSNDGKLRGVVDLFQHSTWFFLKNIHELVRLNRSNTENKCYILTETNLALVYALYLCLLLLLLLCWTNYSSCDEDEQHCAAILLYKVGFCCFLNHITWVLLFSKPYKICL